MDLEHISKSWVNYQRKPWASYPCHHTCMAALQATEKRLAGNAEARGGDLQRAVVLYTEGIEQNPPSGAHMLYSNRAGARLASGDKIGAINDANTAAALSPEGFHTAYIRQASYTFRRPSHNRTGKAKQRATMRRAVHPTHNHVVDNLRAVVQGIMDGDFPVVSSGGSICCTWEAQRS